MLQLALFDNVSNFFTDIANYVNDILSALLGFFDTFVSIGRAAFDFLIGLVDSSISLLIIVVQTVLVPIGIIDFLPSIIGTSVIAMIGISVVKLIFGR